jgi:hypothetical protein
VAPELRLITAPGETYAALARVPVASTLATALRRPLLVALVTGASLAMTATGRVTPALMTSTTVTWSYIVLLQLAIAAPLVVPRGRRTVGAARAIDLFFAGHAPWSLFILLLGAVMPLPSGWPDLLLVAAALVPLVLTARIVAAFFREVLGMRPRAARRMMVLHQALTWTAFLAVNWLQSSFTPRILGLWQ